MTKREAGQLGGLSTFKRYGKKHMRKIGKLGAKVFWDRHIRVPVGTANFAIVNKETGKVVNTLFTWRM